MRTGLDHGELLERGAELQALHDELDAVDPRAPGRLVLIAGEAGVGKTALIRRFCDEASRRARVLWGACDPLFTPRPLGPLFDVAGEVGGALETFVFGGGAPHEVIGPLADALRSRVPTVFVLEDLHWADEATLDVLRLLARRLESLPALVVVTYRDDELGPAQPLRIVLGDLATHRAVERLRLTPLSSAGVATLAGASGLDVGELYRATGGNPFFVTEVLAAGGEGIPATVRDAVLARTMRLGEAARLVLEAAAAVPREVELWLLEALAPEAQEALDELLASGMLVAGDTGVRFRHEIARLTVEQALAPHRRLALHERALGALAEPPGGGAQDLPRLAHHAEAAGDRQAVLRFAPAAAAHAADRGAHREAAAHYALALRFADGEPNTTRAELLEKRSHECYLIDDSAGAIDALEAALACYRELGDERHQAVVLTALSDVLWCPGRTAEARDCAHRAVGLLERHEPGRDLAFAWAVLAQLYMDAGEFDVACDFAGRAMALAERIDEASVGLNADITLQASTLMLGDDAARGRLEAARDLAARSGRQQLAGRAWLLLAWTSLSGRAYATFDSDVTGGIDHARRHGIDLYELYLTAYRSRWQLYQGDWDQALDSAATVLRHTQVSRTPRISALVVTGLIAARRGEPGGVELVDEALAIAVPSNELQRVGAAAAGRAELAWLEGDLAAVDRATAEALAFTECRHAPWLAGELVAWRHRAGLDAEPTPGLPEPYAAELASDWRRAAAFWDEAGCRYEAALVRAAGDEAAQRDALAGFHALGATKTAAMVARRLREQGARGLPRGPRKATQNNPGRLTAREVEVLRLVAEGLHNGEIAGRLFVSEKTVSHHVSAILRKLDVRTRGQASLEAVRLGLVASDRELS